MSVKLQLYFNDQWRDSIFLMEYIDILKKGWSKYLVCISMQQFILYFRQNKFYNSPYLNTLKAQMQRNDFHTQPTNTIAVFDSHEKLDQEMEPLGRTRDVQRPSCVCSCAICYEKEGYYQRVLNDGRSDSFSVMMPRCKECHKERKSKYYIQEGKMMECLECNGALDANEYSCEGCGIVFPYSHRDFGLQESKRKFKRRGDNPHRKTQRLCEGCIAFGEWRRCQKILDVINRPSSVTISVSFLGHDSDQRLGPGTF